MTVISPRVWDFVDLLKELNDQKTLDELNDALTTLIKTVKERGAKGTLTYQVTIDPVWVDDGVEIQFALDDKITLKLPEKKRSREFLFAGRGSELYASNPFTPDPDEQAVLAEIVEDELDPDMFTDSVPAQIEAAPNEEELLS